MMQPMAGPWLSPNEVTANKVPKVLPAMMSSDFTPPCFPPTHLPFRINHFSQNLLYNLSQLRVETRTVTCEKIA